MKKARFITHPSLVGNPVEHPWKNMKFNSYERDLVPGKGLLNLLCEFAPEPGRAVEKITLRATALGIFDLFLNGQRIGLEVDGIPTADEYKPGWTDYRKRVFEYEYDITELCRENNRIVAEVSPGWWTGRISFGFYGFKPMAFAGEIEIEYADGENDIIATGEDWKASICGPVMFADIWDGEYYDATVPEPSIAPEAHEWTNAILFTDCTCEIVPLVGPAIRPRHELLLRPISAVCHNGTIHDGSEYGEIDVISKTVGDWCEQTRLEYGEAMILDMGQNMVGRPIINIKAPRGTKITVYFAEMLNDSGEPSRGNDGPKGSMYIKNYRSAMARLVYVASGNGIETYFPTHSFFGFRYLEIRADNDVDILSVAGEVICSEFTETAEFSCDNPEVNRLYSNIVWGMRGNYFSVPTDCPQRDERLGWTGDTQIFAGAASYLADIRSFMHKWLGDARDSQQGYDGAYCDVIPRVFTSHSGNAAWGDAGLIVPNKLYEMYNDTAILEEHFDSMEYYMQYLEQFGLEGPNTAYGDWLNYDVTDKRYIAVAYYAYDAALMKKFCDILGKPERAEYYAELRERIVSHFRSRYIENGDLNIQTQTAYLLALAFDLVPAEDRQTYIDRLEKKIIDNDYTLSTGFVGTGILNQTLEKLGLHSLCYSLLLQTRDPSWLYSVRQGATTVWERWNSYTLERGFGDVGMNSFNHYAYGAVAEWLYSGMCGIKPDTEMPGWEHFFLAPTPDMRRDDELPEGQKRITTARAAYESVAGRIESAWVSVGDKFEYSFLIPEESAATVSLVSEKDTFKINGIEFKLEEMNGRRQGDRILFPLSEGAYTVVIG